MAKLNFGYDEDSDHLTIEGVVWSGDVFRSFAKTGFSRCGPLTRLYRSQDNGCVMMEQFYTWDVVGDAFREWQATEGE